MLSAVFSGIYPASVDDKGRVHIPAPIGRELPAESELRIGIRNENGDRALMVFPQESYRAMVSGLLERGKTDPALRKLHRITSMNFFAASIKGGKLLVPQEIRKQFELSKNVQVAGVTDHFEIWNEADLKTKRPDKGIDLMEDELEQLGIL